MTTHHYAFARLFIKLATLLAILVALAGLALAAFRFQAMFSDYTGQAYRPDPDLHSFAKRVDASYSGSQARLLRSLSVSSFPSNVKLIDVQKLLANVQQRKTSDLPSGYSEMADEISSSVGAIRKFYSDEYRKAIQTLIDALRSHANQLKDQLKTETSPQGAASVPTTQAIAAGPSAFRIFNDSITSDRQRIENINNLKAVLDVLQDQGKKPESLAAIAIASAHLKQAEDLLDLDLLNAKMVPAPQLSPSVSAEPTNQEIVSRADLVANRLQQSSVEFEESVLAMWVVDEDLEALKLLANKEEHQSADSGIRQRQTILAGVRDCMGFIITACFAAFLIMVVADLIRAFLNLSNNSDTMAFVYESAVPQQEVVYEDQNSVAESQE